MNMNMNIVMYNANMNDSLISCTASHAATIHFTDNVSPLSRYVDFRANIMADDSFRRFSMKFKAMLQCLDLLYPESYNLPTNTTKD